MQKREKSHGVIILNSASTVKPLAAPKSTVTVRIVGAILVIARFNPF
jgi:hypothetical protein